MSSYIPDIEQYLAAHVVTEDGGLERLHTEGLDAEDFAEPGSYAIVRVAEELQAEGEPVTPNTVRQLLKQKDVWEGRGGQAWWSDIIGGGQDASGIETAVRYVRAASELRSADDIAQEISHLSQNGHDPTDAVGEARELTGDLLQAQHSATSTVLDGQALGQGVIDLLDSDEEANIYLPTGFPGLDRSIDGLNVGRVNVVAARSNHGKSAWCDQLMLNVARRWQGTEKRVLKFDLENTPMDLKARLSSTLSSVPVREVQQAFQGKRELPDEKAQHLVQAASTLSDLPLKVDSHSSADSKYIRSRVLSEQSSGKVGLVIVDYITQMAEEGDSSMEKVMRSLSALHALAKDQGIPVVVVAQINRAPLSADSPEPQIHHLMWSDELAQKPAQVLMLHHPHAHWEQTETQMTDEPDPERLFLFVRKNKGGQGSYEFRFDQSTLRIDDPQDPESRHPNQEAPF